MARPRKLDLVDYEAWAQNTRNLSPATVLTYATLVRGIIHRTDISADQILAYVNTLSPRTAALSRTAWRLFVEFMRVRQFNIPNPFGEAGLPGVHYASLTSNPNVTPLNAGEAQAPLSTSISSSVRPAQKPVANMLEMPEHVEKAIRKFIHRNPGIMKVLHRLRWDWTVYNEYTQRWETAYPGEKVETWLVLDPPFLDIIGPWGYGEERPKSGYFIPKAYQSIEPVPDYLLRSVFGDGK